MHISTPITGHLFCKLASVACTFLQAARILPDTHREFLSVDFANLRQVVLETLLSAHEININLYIFIYIYIYISKIGNEREFLFSTFGYFSFISSGEYFFLASAQNRKSVHVLCYAR